MVLKGEPLRVAMVREEGFFRASMLRTEGFFRAAKAATVGDEGFLKTGQEPAWCPRDSPGPPNRIATREETAVLVTILYLEKVLLPSLAGYQPKMALRVDFLHLIFLTRHVRRCP